VVKLETHGWPALVLHKALQTADNRRSAEKVKARRKKGSGNKLMPDAGSGFVVNGPFEPDL
jgi:hypothetical protein